MLLGGAKDALFHRASISFRKLGIVEFDYDLVVDELRLRFAMYYHIPYLSHLSIGLGMAPQNICDGQKVPRNKHQD